MGNIIDSNRQQACGGTCICPFITEPEGIISLHHYPPGDEGRGRLIQMIQQSFNAAYEAEVKDYCDELIGLDVDRQLQGVAGLRPGNNAVMFSEQYLDDPADHLIRKHTGQDVNRHRMVEIGNLVVTGTGNTRWLFVALNAFLFAAGFQWVICTAISPLIRLFQRIGLDPVVLCDADPARLSADGSSWGCYYDLKPKVCFGSIDAGHKKISAAITSRHPLLQKLYAESYVAGAEYANHRKSQQSAVNQ